LALTRARAHVPLAARVMLTQNCSPSNLSKAVDGAAQLFMYPAVRVLAFLPP
jgi:hypothetical protein